MVSEIFRNHGVLPATRCSRRRSDDAATARASIAKQLSLADPVVRSVALKPQVRAVLSELFGTESYYLWGAQLLDRNVGQAHPWHGDLET